MASRKVPGGQYASVIVLAITLSALKRLHCSHFPLVSPFTYKYSDVLRDRIPLSESRGSHDDAVRRYLELHQPCM